VKFRKGFEDLFDDKLEYAYSRPMDPHRDQIMKKLKVNESLNIPSSKICEPVVAPHHKHHNRFNETEASSAPKFVPRVQLEKQRLMSPLPRKRVFRIKNENEEHLVLEKMRQIGGYSSINKANISITKESILKYFREFYSRPHRIVDFLEFQNV
jgi:hypothetical protein